MYNPSLSVPALLALLTAASLATVSRPGRAQAAPKPGNSGPVRGTVFGKDGKPAAGCPVYLILNVYDPKNDRGHYTLCGSAKTDTAGRFVLPNAPSRPENSSLSVLARPAGQAGLSAVPADSQDPVEVSLTPTRKVRGQVNDGQGRPLAAAAITADTLNFRTGDTLAGSWTSVQLPEAMKKGWTVRTDAKGEFVFSLAPENGGASLGVQREGYNEGSIWINSTGTLQPVTLYQRTRIRGMVKPSDPAMRLEGFFVAVGRKNERWRSARIDHNGTFQVDNVTPGADELKLNGGPTSEWQPQAQMKLTVPEGKTLEGVVLAVEAVRGVHVTGRVVDDETGKGIPELGINLPSGSALSTDRDGGYSFYAPAGKVSVTVYRASTPSLDYLIPPEGRSGSVSGAAGQALTLEEIRLRKGKSLAVRVVDTAGKPVKGATVRNETETDPWSAPTSVTDARGECSLRGLAPDVSVRLSARSKSAFAAPLPVDLKMEAGPVTLVVRPELAVRLAGRVVDDAGKPVSGASVQVSEMYDRWGQFPAALTTDAGGRFQSGALPPAANYSVSVQAPRHRTLSSEPWKAREGGVHDFGTLQLVRQLGYVAGTVVDAKGRPVAGARVFNSGDADAPVQTTSDASGRFRLEGLEKGPCYVFAEKRGAPLAVLRTSAPDEHARLVLRPLVLSSVTPALTAAREQFAMEAIDQLVQETEGKANQDSTRQRIVDLLTPRDTLRATELALSTGSACRNSLSNGLARIALARNVDEAVGCIRQVDDPFWRAYYMLQLAAAATPEQARQILPAAVAAARGVPEWMQQLYVLAECADQMRRREVPGAEALLKECAARAARLGVKDQEAYYRGVVAERLAEVDLDGAMALMAPIEDRNERVRHLGNIALRYVTRAPEKALQLLESAAADEWQAQGLIARMCARLAATDPARAEALLERLNERQNRVSAMLWMAERVKDRKRALALLARAEQELAGWATSSNPESSYDNPALHLVRAAIVARKLGYPGAPRLLARALAARPPLAARYGDAYEQQSLQAKLAVLVSVADPAAGRDLVGILLPRLGDVRVPKYDWMETQIRQELLLAAALSDPPRAEEYRRKLAKTSANVNALNAAEFVLDHGKQQEHLDRLLMIASPEADD